MRLLPLCLLVACEAPRADGPNLLFVILDDIGTDKVSVYGAADAPPTPNLDALAAEGIRFDRAYADPFCSPTRAGFLTGRHAYHYGIGTYLTADSSWSLPRDEVTLAEALRGYDTAAVGKLHVGGPLDARPHKSVALDQGFDHYEGAPENLMHGTLSDGVAEDYFHYDRLDGDRWTLVDDGYATTDVTDTALRLVGEMEEPWFLQVGYHSAHKPWHVPPTDVNPLGAVEGDPDTVLYDAMVASLDQELGRLLDGLDDDLRARTLIVVVGDNGTPAEVKTGEEADRPGKGSVSEGGTHVPLIVAGDIGAPGVSTALVSHVDLFATLVEVSGVDAEVPYDSVSFAPILDEPLHPALRDHVYAEVFEPRGPGPHTELYDRMVRGERYKLIRRIDVDDQLFDLESDPLEQDDLLLAPLSPDAQEAWEALEERMDVYTLLGR